MVSTEFELFTKLLQSAKVINDSELNEAVKCAKHLDIPLERALAMLKVASEEKLKPAITAKQMVTAGKISLDEASRVLQHANQHGITFEEAMPKKEEELENKYGGKVIRLSTSKPVHPLAEYFLALKLINPDHLNDAVQKSKTMSLPLGKTLVISRSMTRWVLGEILTAANLVEQEIITKEQAIKFLHDALQRKVSLIQILFESGNYQNASGNSLTLPELLTMAFCLTEADFQDIEERKLVEKKSYVQIISEYKLVESNLFQASVSALEMVGDYLKGFQAAEALKQVSLKKIPLYQAIAELKPPPQVPQPQLRLGDLLVEAGIISRDTVENMIASESPNSTLVRIGKKLLDAHMIDDTNLYNALRCQSVFREGILSAQQTVAVLSCAYEDKLKLDEAFTQCRVYASIRMQWNWQ